MTKQVSHDDKGEGKGKGKAGKIPAEYKPDPMDPSLQEALLALLCHSSKEGAQIAAQIPVELYDSGCHREIAKAAIAYRSKYGKPPRERQMDILIERLPIPKDQIKVAQLIAAKGANLLKGLNKEYVVSQASEFAIRQTLRKASLAAASPICRCSVVIGSHVARSRRRAMVLLLVVGPSLSGRERALCKYRTLLGLHRALLW